MRGNAQVPNPVTQAWNESAPYWQKYRRVIAQMFQPLSKAMIEEAQIARGQTILEVAAGTGEPSLSIAHLCGPSGWVACTDIAATMLAAAKADALLGKIRNVHFVQCSGDWLPFRSSSFDAAVSRLGIMFFSDPPQSVRQMLHVLKPGAKLAFAVWHRSKGNPFFYLPNQILARHLETPAFDPEAPGPFRYSPPGKLANLLERAGAADVRERALKFRIEASIPLDDFWTLRSEMSETIRGRIGSLSAEKRSVVAQEVREAAREFFANDRISFPAEALLVSGRRPQAHGGQ